jgi:DNA primase
MASVLEAIRSVSPDYAARARSGHNYYLLPCPFHSGGTERTPSCSVSTDKPVFYCHACQESGHLSRLLREIGAVPSVAKSLVEKIGYSSGGGSVKKGLAGQFTGGIDPYRGDFILDDDILDEYRVAPTSFIEAGFHKSTLRHFEVGVDVSRARITFPIRNLYGELVGISGRTMIDEEPRYKIYRRELTERGKYEGWEIPEEYSIESIKRTTLWHAHIVYPFLIESEESVVLTEGFKACMWVYQAGFSTTMACMGSRVSDPHANLLARACKRVVLFLDNNEAGIIGAAKGAQTLERRGLEVFIARYPDDRGQPDDLDPQEVENAILNAWRFIEWRRQ